MLYSRAVSTMDTLDPLCAAEGCAGIDLVIEGRPRPVGNIDVARLLPVRERRAVGPFIFLDHMGPVTFAPGAGFDVAPHPHIGLSTVTYLLEGEAVHRDSIGSVQVVTPGEINLMTAGRGVVHSERSDPAWRARGGTFHGLQLWLGLPTESEEDEPWFVHRDRDAFPRVDAAGVSARVLLGSALGVTAPIEHPARPVMIDVDLAAGAIFDVPNEGGEHAVYIVEGEVSAGSRTFARHRLLVAAPAQKLCLVARQPSRVVVIGGPPLDGKRFMDWNFVHSTRERIEQAKAAWRDQTFPRIPGDDREHIPYPTFERR
ncbi:Pirin-related protein [Minicystis rosea]|nr:Pirin-related protein [Minicystis rosea]